MLPIGDGAKSKKRVVVFKPLFSVTLSCCKISSAYSGKLGGS